MKKWTILIIACVLGAPLISYKSFKPKKYKHQLAVAIMFKNEAPNLKEWIEYHQVIGATHFYLYNNESTDNYAEVLVPYVASGLVELIDWAKVPEHAIWGLWDENWVPYQLGAWKDLFENRALGIDQWVAILDVDEFIVPNYEAKPLLELLDSEVKKKTGSLAIYLRYFGTSGVKTIGPNDLMTEKLTMRAFNDYKLNTIPKSIHRPEAVKICLNNLPKKLHKGYSLKYLDRDKYQINHYYTGPEDVALSKRALKPGCDELNELNAMVDWSIYKYLPELKKAMQSVPSE